MPSRHRYKCLNPNCPSMTDAKKSMLFVAMNQQPACPQCGARKLEDWGEAVNIMGGLSDNSRNSDRNFRRVADRYGLTDMNNKDGQAVKRAAPQVVTKGEELVKVGGFMIPKSQAISGQCINQQSAAKSLKTDFKAIPKKSGMLQGMTRVVAEHKA